MKPFHQTRHTRVSRRLRSSGYWLFMFECRLLQMLKDNWHHMGHSSLMWLQPASKPIIAATQMAGRLYRLHNRLQAEPLPHTLGRMPSSICSMQSRLDA